MASYRLQRGNDGRTGIAVNVRFGALCGHRSDVAPCPISANSGLVNVRRNSKSRRSLFVFPLPAALQNQTDLAASGLRDI
jgi:hypothetical protein